MQNILALDIAADPIRASVLKIEGRDIHVLEKLEGELGSLFTRDNLCPAADPDEEGREDGQSTEEEGEEEGARLVHAQHFKDFLKSIKAPWSNAIVIVPPYEVTSLNLSLPFGDTKNIEKIIDMEVQDVVPFDISEFLIQHQVVDARDDGSFEVHASLMPRKYIESLLQLFSAAQFEPAILSTPGAAIAAVYHLAPDYIAENSAVVLSRNGQFHVIVAINGQVKIDRVIDGTVASPSSGTNGSGPALVNPLVDLKLTIASAERTYDTSLQKVYFIGPQAESIPLRQSLGREVELLPPSDFTKGSVSSTIADMASIFVHDEDPPPILTNFRTREFAYSPELKNLFRAFKQLTPYLLGILVAVFVCFGSIYTVRALRIARTQEAVRHHIATAAPDISLPEGQEIRALKGQINALREQLEDIGEAAAFSPLDAFIEVTRIFSRFPNRKINKVEIKGNRVKIEGVASSHNNLRDMREAFEKRKPVRCRFKKQDVRPSTHSQISFTFMATCE